MARWGWAGPLDGLDLVVGRSARLDKSPQPGDDVQVRGRLGDAGAVLAERIGRREGLFAARAGALALGELRPLDNGRSLMPVQLRLYTIKAGALDAFASEWAENIRPLRLSLGFSIWGAWKVEATNQFVWVMAYEGPESWDVLDRAYHKSPQRRTMQPDPARHIVRMEHHFIEPV